MTGQPYMRQVRYLVACTAIAAAIAICSLCLIRVECNRLAAGAATERALRVDLHERLVRLDAARMRLAMAANTQEFAAADAGLRALGGHSEELLRAVRDRLLASERRGEARRALLREIESAGAVTTVARIRQLALASSPQAQERRSETAGVLADPRQAFELAPQRELAAIRNAGQRQEDALQQVAILSGMILLAGVSGAASLISAARILTCHLQHEISALQSLYKHTVKKTNRIFDKVGGVASAIGRVAVKLPPARGERRAAEWIDSATDAARALQSSVVEIGRVTEQIRGIAFKIGIPDLQTAVVSAGAGDQSADFGIVATEVKRLATDTATCAAEIRTQVRTLESHLAGVGARLRQLRETDAERDAVAPSLPRSLASEQEQLYKLAAAMEELCGKPAPDRSNIRWPKSTQNVASVLLQSVPGIWP